MRNKFQNVLDDLGEIVLALESNPSKFVENEAPELIMEAQGESTAIAPILLGHIIGSRNVPENMQSLYDRYDRHSTLAGMVEDDNDSQY